MRDSKGIWLALAVGTTLLTIALFNPFGPRLQQVTICSPTGKVTVATAKTTVGEVLHQAGIELAPDERVYPGLSEAAAANYINIVRGKQVTVIAAGEESTVVTWLGTVGDLATELGYEHENNLFSCPLEQRLSEGLTIRIIRTETKVVSEEQSIASRTVYKDDPKLPAGQTKVAIKAQPGQKVLTYEVVYRDGSEAARRLVEASTVVQPIVGVIHKGTKIVSRGPGEITEGFASYYGSELHGRRTASGVPFDMHAFTAAHRTLPFGTLVKVTLLATGKSVVVEINDRGPFIPGRIIDLSAAAAKEIGLYSRGVSKVKIEIVQ